MTDAQANIRINVDTSIGIAEIKNLQRQIAQLNAELLQSGAQQVRAAQNVQRNLINNINATGKFAASVKTVSSTAESFTTALERNKLSMGEYFRYAGASTKTFGRLFKSEFDTIQKVAESRVKTLQTQYVKLGRDANGALKAIAVRPLALDMDSLATKTALAAQRQQLFNQLLKQGSTNLLNFGKNTQWAGRQLMVGFTIPLSIFATTASKAFMQMEEQAIRFKRVYGDSFTATEETDKMLDQVKNLAKEFTKYGVAVEKTMAMAADAAAMGLMNADLLAQINQATRLSVLGGVAQEQALETTISLMNAFGTSARDLTKDINFLNAVENQTVTAIEDLTIAIPKAAPVIKQLGGDVQDLAFFLTAMKEGGINASEGANALKSGLASLINPTEKASQMLAGFGINIRQIVETNKGDVKGTVVAFAQALDTLDPLSRARAIEQLFGKFQFARLSTLFQNVIKQGTQAQRVLQLTRASSEELAILSERELRRVEESPMFKFKKAVEDIKVSLVPLGEAFLKAITPVIEFAKGFLDRFNSMSDGAKQFAVVATTVVAGIGPVLLMTFGLIANGVANLIKMFAAISNIFRGAGKASSELGISTEYMTQQQLEAAAVAASLDQSHARLIQTFTAETGAVNNLAAAYSRALVQQARLLGLDPETFRPVGGRGRAPKKYARGVVSVPGPKGAGDVVPAMLSPGEAIIPARQSAKYAGLIQGMIDDNVPGYKFGRNPFAFLIKKFQSKRNPVEELLRFLTGTQGLGSRYTDSQAVKFLRSQPNVAVRMKSEDLFSLIASKDKRYKSVFETGQSRAGDTPAKRAEVEKALFGLPENVDPRQRPVYGYLFKQERGLTIPVKRNKDGSSKQLDLGPRIFEKLTGKSLGTFPTTRGSEKRFIEGSTGSLMNRKAFRYGELALILKKRNIKNRTTFTYGDSYNRVFDEFATPAPLGTLSKKKIEKARTSKDKDFFEAQILGGFTLKDVKRIVTTEPQRIPQLQAALQQAGFNIPVGMPRFSMMQRLQRIIYGKKAKADRLPFVAKYGPKAGKYTNPPIDLGNRKVWLSRGTQAVPSMDFDRSMTLQMAHMAGAVSGDGTLSEAQLRKAFDEQVKAGVSSGAFGRLGIDPVKLTAQFRKKLEEDAKEYKQFKLYANLVEPGLSSSNQDTANPFATKPGGQYLKELKALPRGLFGSGILGRLPKNHGIPNRILKSYILNIQKSYESRLKANYGKQLLESDTHKLYLEAERNAIRKLKDPAARQIINDANLVGRLGLTYGVPGKSKTPGKTPGYSRRYLPSLWGNIQEKTRELRSGTLYSEIFGKKFSDTLDEKFLRKTKINIPRESKDQAKALFDSLSKKDKMELSKRLISVSDIQDSDKRFAAYKQVLSDWQEGKPFVISEKTKTPSSRKAAARVSVSGAGLKASGAQSVSIKKQLAAITGKAAGVAGIIASLLSLLSPDGSVLKAANGIVSVPGPKGAGDIIPAMLSPGEAVIPAKQSEKYAGLIQQMVHGKIPGYEDSNVPKGPLVRDPFAIMGNQTIVQPKQDPKVAEIQGRATGEALGKARGFVGQVGNNVRKGLASVGTKAVETSGKLLDKGMTAAASRTGIMGAIANRFFGPSPEALAAEKLKAAGLTQGSKGGYYDAATGKYVKPSIAQQRLDATRQSSAANRSMREPGSRAGMIGGVAGTAAMAYGMTGLPGAEMAMMASMPLMFMGPMLANPIFIAVAALGGLAATLIMTNNRLKEVEKEATKLAKSLGSGNDQLNVFAEAAGNVTASDIMSRRRASEGSLLQVQPGKAYFGDTFLQSEGGKALLSSVEAGIITFGKQVANEKLGEQLFSAVVSGALSVDQARSVAASIGEQINDLNFGMNINAKLSKIFGPNGENLEKDPLSITVQLVSQTEGNIEDAFANWERTSELFSGGLFDGAFTANAEKATAWVDLYNQELTKLNSTQDWYQQNMPYLASITNSITAVFNASSAAATKTAESYGTLVGEVTSGLSAYQQAIDSTEILYERQIEAAEAAGDFEKAEVLRQKQTSANQKIIDRYSASIAQLSGRFKELTTRDQDRLINSINESILAGIDDQKAKDEAKKVLDAVSSQVRSGDITSEISFILKTQVAAGSLSIDDLRNFTEMSAETKTATFRIIPKINPRDFAQVLKISGIFIGPDGKPNKQLQTKFVAQFEGKNQQQITDILSVFNQIAGFSGLIGEQATSNLAANYLGDPTQTTNLLQDLKDIKEITKGGFKIEIIQELLGADVADAVKRNQDYFDSLDPVQKVVYLQVLATLALPIMSGDMDKEVLAWAAETGKLPTTGSADRREAMIKSALPRLRQQYMDEQPWLATLSNQLADALGGDGGNGGGGGGGTKANPINDILNKLKMVRNSAINASGGIKTLRDVMKDGTKTTTEFLGIEQKLLGMGVSQEFISAVMSMDKEYQKFFISTEKGVVKLTKDGERLAQSLNEISLGQFQVSLTADLQAVNAQITAMNKLTAAKVSVADASEIVQDKQLALAIAHATDTKEVTDLVNAYNKLKKAEQSLLLSTPEGRQRQLQEVSSEAAAFFAAQEEQANLQYENSLKAYEKANGIVQAQRDIADKQFKVDDLEYALSQIETKESKINDEYDRRQQAIESIFAANKAVLDQDKERLDIASSLASGDLASAARAMRAQTLANLERNKEAQLDNLQKSRELELAQVRDETGKSRLQIEKEILDLEKEIADLQQKKLVPYEKEIERLDRIREDALESVSSTGFLGLTQSRWEQIANEVERARLNVDGYAASLKNKLLEIPGITTDANGNLTFDAGKIVNPATAGPTTPAPVSVEPEPPAVDSEKKKQIDELNRLIQITRWRIKNEKDLKASTKDWLINKNIERINKVRSLGGTPNMSGVIAPGTVGRITQLPEGWAAGGLIPKYMRMGGLLPYKAEGGTIFAPMGTDTVPAMLTPGEFVVRRHAVNSFGVDRLKAINNGTYKGDSMYNYNVSINVKSDANPDEIARSVMTQIKRIDSQRIRGNRF